MSKRGKARHFFPHRLYYLPKCGPDGFQTAERLFTGVEPNQLWEILLYADPRIIADLPADLWFDDDIIWHQQQLGMAGHVASANLIVRGDALYTNNHFSDLVQRISRRRECKTRVENRFKGWNHLLLNGILNFAVEHNLKRIYTPTADLVVELADPKRRHTLQRELFDRIYDRDVNARFKPGRAGAWWMIDVAEHRDRLVVPEKKEMRAETKTKTICLYHDIERGIAHTRVDPQLAQFANRNAANTLEQMLCIEKECNVRATYNIVGLFLQEIRARITQEGHCISFHSYNHETGFDPADMVWRLGARGITGRQRRYVHVMQKALRRLPLLSRAAGLQLQECRRVDYRVKGYHPPKSRLTPELADTNLCYHNFEWLAISPRVVGSRLPQLQNRVAKIPVHFDDFNLYQHETSYPSWEQTAIQTIEENEFIVFGLHDCYASYWLPHYRGLLQRLSLLGEFKTLDQIAAGVFFAAAR